MLTWSDSARRFTDKLLKYGVQRCERAWDNCSDSGRVGISRDHWVNGGKAVRVTSEAIWAWKVVYRECSGDPLIPISLQPSCRPSTPDRYLRFIGRNPRLGCAEGRSHGLHTYNLPPATLPRQCSREAEVGTGLTL